MLKYHNMKIFEEFKKFAIKGNVIDMSIGIIIGGAFTQIVNSFVRDMIMPPLGLLTGNMDFSERVFILKKATEETTEISMNYGLFLNAVLNFLIISITVFFVIRYINKLKEAAEKRAKATESLNEIKNDTPPKKDPNIELLTEIRDLLKKDQNQDN